VIKLLMLMCGYAVYLKSDDELSDSRPSTRGSNRVRQDLLEDEELFPETR
jgi:hypothetical protein